MPDNGGGFCIMRHDRFPREEHQAMSRKLNLWGVTCTRVHRGYQLELYCRLGSIDFPDSRRHLSFPMFPLPLR